MPLKPKSISFIKEKKIHKKADPFYSSSKWRKVRRRQLAMHPLCKCKEPATDVDHIKPRSEGGADLEYENLQSLCKSCHSKKTRRENK